jgi:hypothetical protein
MYMSMNSPYGDPGAPPADILLAWKICLGGWKPGGPVTLRNPGDRAMWCAGYWLHVLIPAIAGAHARAAHPLRLAEWDSGNDFGPSTFTSRAQGSRFLQRFSRTTGDKAWRQYLAEYDRGRAAGHFAICLGARAARFHISVRQALALALAVEARGAGIAFRSEEFTAMLASLPAPESLCLQAA